MKMIERQISQVNGREGDYYSFMIGDDEEVMVLKVFHSLTEAQNWQVGSFVEFIDYDQFAKEFLESKGNISYSISGICDMDFGNRKLLEEIKAKFESTKEIIIKKLKDAIVKKRFAILAEEILRQIPPIWNERREVRDWLIARGVGDYQVCEELSSREFHTFRLYDYEKKQEKEKAKVYKEIEINDQEEITYKPFDLCPLVENFLLKPYWHTPLYYYDGGDPLKMERRTDKIRSGLSKEVSEYIKINNLNVTSWALSNVVFEKIWAGKGCEYKYNCNERVNLWEKFCERHVKECSASNCSQRTSFSQRYCRPECAKHYCNVDNCSARISWKLSFCEMHSLVCKENSCSLRTSRRKLYCLEHREICQVSFSRCPIRIPANTTYCAHHQTYRLCYESPTCQEEILVSETHCSYHQEQRSEQANLKSIVESKLPYLSSPKEVVRFTTWWNNNLATVVNYNSGYWVFLVVYDNFQKKGEIKEDLNFWVFPSNHSQNCWGMEGNNSRKGHNYLCDAQSEASWLRGKLTCDNPILYVHPEANSYAHITNIIRKPYVKDYSVGSSSIFNYIIYVVGELEIPSNLDNYIKPLDIVKVKMQTSGVTEYYHFGIYLGRNQILDLGSDNQGTWILSCEKGKNFLKGAISHITAYHPIIPFKHYKNIIEHVVKANLVHYGKGNYCLSSHNCEHCAWGLGIGVYFSRQSDNHDFATSFWCDKFHSCSANSGRENICLRNEINETDSKFDNLISLVNSDEVKDLEARIEIPAYIPYDQCRIM